MVGLKALICSLQVCFNNVAGIGDGTSGDTAAPASHKTTQVTDVIDGAWTHIGAPCAFCFVVCEKKANSTRHVPHKGREQSRGEPVKALIADSLDQTVERILILHAYCALALYLHATLDEFGRVVDRGG